MDTPDLLRIAAFEMRSHGLAPEFTTAALSEAQALPEPVPAEPGDVRNQRERLWFSIDNADTLDLDQLSWAHSLADGAIRLAVAVADVALRVPRDSALDAHAAANTTSVYTAARIFPMLPTRLSNDLTSLREGADRHAVVVEMDIDGDGAVTASQLYRAQVRNQAKLDYDSIAAWLDGSSAAPARVAASHGLRMLLCKRTRNGNR